MIDFYFREVIIFDKKRINGDGESLFSFSPAPVNRYRKGHQEVLVLDIRKQNKMSLELYNCELQNPKPPFLY